METNTAPSRRDNLYQRKGPPRAGLGLTAPTTRTPRTLDMNASTVAATATLAVGMPSHRCQNRTQASEPWWPAVVASLHPSTAAMTAVGAPTHRHHIAVLDGCVR